MATDTTKLAKRLLAILNRDRPALLRIDAYMQGEQDDPYMPDNADAEYRLLAERSITNVCPFVIGTPAQAMYVDLFRRGKSDVDTDNAGQGRKVVTESRVAPEWDHWQKSRLDARQAAIYRGALQFGHSFTVTEKTPKGVRTRGLSALRTAAAFEDPANDDAPIGALTVKVFPDASDEKLGKATMWDGKNVYEVTFDSLSAPDKITVGKGKSHGASECPVTRFAAAIDLEGRTCGVIAPLIPLQNRINQTVFDLLVVQSYASFKVRTISGMAPPVKMVALDAEGNRIDLVREPSRQDEVVEWVEDIDPKTGQPIPLPVNMSAKRVFWAEDEDTKFGQLDETPLDGFISAIELAFRHIAALSQTPPHHLLGQIANLSAEALTAAETSLSRKVDEFKSSFGESWERVFRLAAEIGDFDGAEDFHGEVIWRDMEQRSLAQAGDALGKLAESLGIPKKGLWPRVPNVTAGELSHWEDLADEENESSQTVAAIRRASASTRPVFRAAPPSPTPTPEEPAA